MCVYRPCWGSFFVSLAPQSPVLTAPTLLQARRASCMVWPPAWTCRERGDCAGGVAAPSGLSGRPCFSAVMMARLLPCWRGWHGSLLTAAAAAAAATAITPPPPAPPTLPARPDPTAPLPPALPQALREQADAGAKFADLGEEQQQAVRQALRGKPRRLGAGSQAMTPAQMAMLRCIHNAGVAAPAVGQRSGSRDVRRCQGADGTGPRLGCVGRAKPRPLPGGQPTG